MKVALPFPAPLVAVLALAAACARAEHPPVILITVDTLRPDHLGAYGYARPTSPAIDRLAAEGATFERAISQAPWTLPSVSSIITSRYPLDLGTIHMSAALPAGVATAASLFAAAGYDTAAFVMGGYLTAERGFDRGFAVFDPVPEAGRAPAVTEAALEWLSRPRERPVFLWLHYFDPHSDYDAPPPWSSRFGPLPARKELGTTEFLKRVLNGDVALEPAEIASLKDLYDGEVAYADHGIGALLGRLRDTGLLDRAVVAFGADHGEAFMDHGRVLHTSSLYDELVRVPLVVRAPGAVPAGRRVRAVVSNVDILPTLLDLAGVAAPASLRGASLRALAAGGPPAGRPAFSHTDLTSHEKYYEALVPNLNRSLIDTLFMIRDERHKLIRSERTGSYRLYDLSRDPGEARDLWAQDVADGAPLRAALDAWVKDETAHAPASRDVSIAPQERQRLRALGYGD